MYVIIYYQLNYTTCTRILVYERFYFVHFRIAYVEFDQR